MVLLVIHFVHRSCLDPAATQTLFYLAYFIVQVYPYRGVNGLTKDRQGELFYYMHHQMLARYDAERMAVGLSRVEPYINWHLPIPVNRIV